MRFKIKMKRNTNKKIGKEWKYETINFFRKVRRNEEVILLRKKRVIHTNE